MELAKRKKGGQIGNQNAVKASSQRKASLNLIRQARLNLKQYSLLINSINSATNQD